MLWWKRFLAFVGCAWGTAIVASVLALAACSNDTQHRGEQDDTGLGPDLHPAGCAGLCVDTPPATYTGPSLFWIGVPALVPACPPDTPSQGIQGYVQTPQLMELARECRITPTDTCAAEGQTCSPVPPDDFHVCIHHDEDRPCPDGYPQHRTMIQDATTATVTLCCLASLLPG